ncbi:MAG: tyrosine-type recombinase/integrase [Nitrososphaeraceae archaeon]
MKLKKEGKTFSAIHNYVAAVKSFYKINDVILNDSKLSKFMPEHKKSRKDRAYTHQEISKLLEVADDRMRVVILLLSSSGVRIGALPSLRLRNLEDNKLTVYENYRQEYFTFITPECKSAIDSYLDMRKRYGEKLDEDSYLIREQFDIRDPFAIQKPKQITHRAIEWRLISLAERCGIRIREHETENRKYSSIRKDVPIAHGFRKFFTTQLIEADAKTELRWLLEGHNLKANDSHYVRISEKRLQQEYEKAIDNLTIDPANRLQRKVETLTIEKSRVDKLEEKIRRIEKMYQK